MWDRFLGWGGVGGCTLGKKLIFKSFFFSFLMFLAQNQLGKVGEVLVGSQGWVGVGAHWVKICFLIFLEFFMFLAQNLLFRESGA